MKKFWLLIVLLIAFRGLSLGQEKIKQMCIGFYNLENLFDTIHNPHKFDEEFLPNSPKHWNSQKYHIKLKHLAHVINVLGTDDVKTGPVILGVAEAEDRRVLQDLVNQKEIANRHYGIIHFEGPDERGIDVAMLYNPRYFRPINARPVHVELADHHPTRDILYVCGILDRTDTLHILVDHWPSRWGGQKRSEPLRDTAAAVARRIVDSVFALHPNAKIVVMGDLNDDPVDESVVKYLRAKGRIKDLQPGDLYNTMYTKYKKGIGSLAYGDSWDLFDQIMISQALLKKFNKKDKGYKFLKSVVFRAPFLFQKTGRFAGYPFRTYAGDEFLGGYSDHLPTYIILYKKVK